MRFKKKKIFYRADTTTNDKIVGKISPYNINYLKEGYPYDKSNLFKVARWIYKGLTYPDFKPTIGEFKLLRKAKTIDFINCIYTLVPFISKKAFGCLKELNIGDHRVYPVRIYIKGKPTLYYFVGTFRLKQFDYIIWDKCSFSEYEKESIGDEIGSTQYRKIDTEVPIFKSIDDYYIYGYTHILGVDRIAVNGTFPIDLDFFKFNFSGTFVSERFVEIAKANGLTGLDFNKKIEVVQYE